MKKAKMGLVFLVALVLFGFGVVMSGCDSIVGPSDTTTLAPVTTSTAAPTTTAGGTTTTTAGGTTTSSATTTTHLPPYSISGTVSQGTATWDAGMMMVVVFTPEVQDPITHEAILITQGQTSTTYSILGLNPGNYYLAAALFLGLTQEAQIEPPPGTPFGQYADGLGGLIDKSLGGEPTSIEVTHSDFTGINWQTNVTMPPPTTSTTNPSGSTYTITGSVDVTGFGAGKLVVKGYRPYQFSAGPAVFGSAATDIGTSDTSVNYSITGIATEDPDSKGAPYMVYLVAELFKNYPTHQPGDRVGEYSDGKMPPYVDPAYWAVTTDFSAFPNAEMITSDRTINFTSLNSVWVTTTTTIMTKISGSVTPGKTGNLQIIAYTSPGLFGPPAGVSFESVVTAEVGVGKPYVLNVPGQNNYYVVAYNFETSYPLETGALAGEYSSGRLPSGFPYDFWGNFGSRWSNTDTAPAAIPVGTTEVSSIDVTALNSVYTAPTTTTTVLVNISGNVTSPIAGTRGILAYSDTSFSHSVAITLDATTTSETKAYTLSVPTNGTYYIAAFVLQAYPNFGNGDRGGEYSSGDLPGGPYFGPGDSCWSNMTTSPDAIVVGTSDVTGKDITALNCVYTSTTSGGPTTTTTMVTYSISGHVTGAGAKAYMMVVAFDSTGESMSDPDHIVSGTDPISPTGGEADYMLTELAPGTYYIVAWATNSNFKTNMWLNGDPCGAYSSGYLPVGNLFGSVTSNTSADAVVISTGNVTGKNIALNAAAVGDGPPPPPKP